MMMVVVTSPALTVMVQLHEAMAAVAVVAAGLMEVSQEEQGLDTQAPDTAADKLEEVALPGP
jgi:hypothetical protein